MVGEGRWLGCFGAECAVKAGGPECLRVWYGCPRKKRENWQEKDNAMWKRSYNSMRYGLVSRPAHRHIASAKADIGKHEYKIIVEDAMRRYGDVSR